MPDSSWTLMELCEWLFTIRPEGPWTINDIVFYNPKDMRNKITKPEMLAYIEERFESANPAPREKIDLPKFDLYEIEYTGYGSSCILETRTDGPLLILKGISYPISKDSEVISIIKDRMRKLNDFKLQGRNLSSNEKHLIDLTKVVKDNKRNKENQDFFRVF